MKKINECDGGCCDGGSCGVGNLDNTQGVGNAVPAKIAAMTAAEQTNPDSFGSGDKFGGNNIKSKKKKRYYIAKKKNKSYLKIKENLEYNDAISEIDNLNDKDCKIYLMSDD